MTHKLGKDEYTDEQILNLSIQEMAAISRRRWIEGEIIPCVFCIEAKIRDTTIALWERCVTCKAPKILCSKTGSSLYYIKGNRGGFKLWKKAILQLEENGFISHKLYDDIAAFLLKCGARLADLPEYEGGK